MYIETIILLYIRHLIQPLEQLIKNPNFVKKYSKQEQKKWDQLLLHQYKEIEAILKEK